MKRKIASLLKYGNAAIMLAITFGLLFHAARPVFSCAGTNEPWHEITVSDKPPVYLESGYFRVFTTLDGLPENNINCLAFSKKYKTLYIGTRENGVFTFDGKEFRFMLTEPALPAHNILSLAYSEQDDKLAVGTNSGLAIITAPDPKNVLRGTVITTKNGAQSNTVFSLCERSGVFYAGTERGAFSVVMSTVRDVAVKTQNGAEIGRVNSLYSDESGGIYIATDVSIFKTSDMRRFEPAENLPAEHLKFITCVGELKSDMKAAASKNSETPAAAPGQGLVFTSSTGLTISSKAGTPLHYSSQNGIGEDWLTSFAYDNLTEEKKVNISVNDTLIDPEKVTPEEKQALLKNLMSLKLPYTTIEKSGDQIIIKSQSPDIFSNPTILALDRIFNFSGTPRSQKADPKLEAIKKGLWIGTKNSGLCVYNGTDFINFTRENSPLLSNQIKQIISTKNFIYAATEGGGLLRYGKYDSPNVESEITQLFDFKPNAIKAIGGDVYVCAGRGLYYYSPAGGDTSSVMAKNQDLLKNLNDISGGQNGIFYAAGGSSGALVLCGMAKDVSGKTIIKNVINFDTAKGAPSNECRSVYHIEGKGTLAGFSGSLKKCSQKCVLITPDYKLQSFTPASNQKLEEYDRTSPSDSPIIGFLNMKESFFTAGGGGDSNALVFCDGAQWNYVTTTGAPITKINSINKSSCNDVYIATDSGVVKFDGRRWNLITDLAGVTLTEAICAARDTYADGLWVLLKKVKKENTPDKCLLIYSGEGGMLTKIIDGYGVTFAQIDSYIIVGTTKGVYKIKKR